VELRQTFAEQDDVIILYVIADNQINDKTLRFIDGLGLRDRVRFASDPGSTAIDTLGVRRETAEPIERGVPHPATYILDRQGIVRFVDEREDFHVWLDSEFTRAALAKVP
jgi:peroxiredoxin